MSLHETIARPRLTFAPPAAHHGLAKAPKKKKRGCKKHRKVGFHVTERQSQWKAKEPSPRVLRSASGTARSDSSQRFFGQSTNGGINLKFYFFTTLLILITLLIPIIPFLLFGDPLERWTSHFFEQEWLVSRPGLTGLLVIAALTSDILLPIPSSVVCTIAGRLLGTLGGTVVCWLGLNGSTCIGYFLGKRFGWPIARWLCSREALHSAEKKIQKWGVWPIVALRGFPVLAEASVLIAGVYRFPAKLFWPPVLVANLGIALAFVAIGEISAHYGWFSFALPISLGLPIAWLVMWLFIWKPQHAFPVTSERDADSSL